MNRKDEPKGGAFTQEDPKRCIFRFLNDHSASCSVCNSTTKYYEDIGAANPLCSEECYEQWWKSYFSALEKQN